MIKLYRVKIEGKVYEVELEAVSEMDGKIEIPKLSSSEQVKPQDDDIVVEAPMQGVVISVEVNVGDRVKAGDTLLILEAMKMENPIVAPVDGVIKSINIKAGDTIDGGTTVVILG